MSSTVCTCPACNYVARRAEHSLLAALSFDICYDMLRRTDAIHLRNAVARP